jgi:hypothetical protein
MLLEFFLEGLVGQPKEKIKRAEEKDRSTEVGESETGYGRATCGCGRGVGEMSIKQPVSVAPNIFPCSLEYFWLRRTSIFCNIKFKKMSFQTNRNLIARKMRWFSLL